ncbi:MAG TPA: hypothetical protein VKQ30_25900 [Ktedonobacterales bacterium]|nr:hypothetical protein [Ktedonobacterales bacterium]
MSSDSLAFLLTFVSAVLMAFGGVVVFFRRKHERDVARREADAEATPIPPRHLPEGLTSGGSRTAFAYEPERDTGRLTLVGVGTHGVKLAARTLLAFRNAGRLSAIGVAAVADLSQRERNRFARFVPAVPEIAARLELSPTTLFPDGLLGRSVAQADQPAVRMLWGAEFDRWLADTMRLIRGTERPCFDTSDPLLAPYDSSHVELLASSGGHWRPSVYTAEVLHTELPLAMLTVTNIIPANPQLRAQFLDGLRALCELACVHLIRLVDERNGQALCDRANATWLAGLYNADADPVNTLRWLGTDDPNTIVVPTVWTRELPFRPSCDGAYPALTFRETVVRAIRDGMEAVFAGKTKLVDLPTRKANTQRVILLHLPLTSEFLLSIKEQVAPMLAASRWYDADTTILWSNTSVPHDDGVLGGPMTIVVLEAARNGIDDVAALLARS